MVKIGDIVDYQVQLRLNTQTTRPGIVVAVDNQDVVGLQVLTNSDAYGNGGDFTPGIFWRYPVNRSDDQLVDTWKPREAEHAADFGRLHQWLEDQNNAIKYEHSSEAVEGSGRDLTLDEFAQLVEPLYVEKEEEATGVVHPEAEGEAAEATEGEVVAPTEDTTTVKSGRKTKTQGV